MVKINELPIIYVGPIMKILITGGRTYQDIDSIRTVLTYLKEGAEITIIHGAARGADSLAGFVAKELGMNVVAEPADWKRYGRGAGPIRNQQMLDMNPDIVIYFHKALADSKGTKDMVNRAKAKGTSIINGDLTAKLISQGKYNGWTLETDLKPL